jgi:hypothetical protein
MGPSREGDNRESNDWFLATLIMEIVISDDARNVVHRNVFLISACSPEEAYTKALKLGHDNEVMYDNPAGGQVRHSFRGVAQLEALVDGEPVDGAELTFEEYVGVHEDEIRGFVRCKERLRAFGQPSVHDGRDVPDYSSKSVIDHIVGEQRENRE